MTQLLNSLFNRFIEKRECIVNMKNGTSFRCVIWSHQGDYLLLKNASLLSTDSGHMKPVQMDGDIVVLRADLDFIQVV